MASHRALDYHQTPKLPRTKMATQHTHLVHQTGREEGSDDDAQEPEDALVLHPDLATPRVSNDRLLGRVEGWMRKMNRRVNSFGV